MSRRDPRHGTWRGYSNDYCRCEPCTQAWAEHARQKRNQQNGLPPGDPRHGTRSAYDYWRCRCPDCTAAKQASRAPLPPDDPRHGTSAGFAGWRNCECLRCRLARAKYLRDRYAARKTRKQGG